MNRLPAYMVLTAACTIALITAAIAVRASLDASDEATSQIGNVQTELAELPAVDLFLALDQQPLILDEFERNKLAKLGRTDTGERWTEAGATWQVNGFAAQLGSWTTSPALAIVPGPLGDRLVSAVFHEVSGGAGIAFGYADSQNYWTVVAAPGFALWQVWRVAGGVGEIVGRLGPPTSSEPGTEVAVHIRPDGLDFYVDRKQVLTISQPLREDARGLGLIGMREGAVDARWDSFAVAAIKEAE